MFGGIVLAAGASKRLGQPKALVEFEGEAAVARCVRLLSEAGCDDVVVVLGADQKAIQKAVPNDAARIVANPDWEQGQTTSLKKGLGSLDVSCCFLIWPVDRPAVRGTTVKALLEQDEKQIRIPTFEGRRGHPVHFEAALREEILALGDNQPLHDVVHKNPRRVHEFAVDDPGILLNVDTPPDLKKLEALAGGPKPARPVA